MSEPKNLLVSYAEEGDLLAIGNGAQAKGGGYSVTRNSFFTGFYAEKDRRQCVGFDLLDAALMLTLYLNGEASQGVVCDGELSVSYCDETDTLILVSNREPVAHNQDVADGLTAHCNELGRAVGFTLKNAGQLLLPYLQGRKAKTGAVS